MQRGVIFGRTVEMQGSPYTLLVFKREFGENLTSFIVDAYKQEEADIECFLRIAWAMAKTYNEDITDYERWLEEFDADAFNLAEGQAAFGVITSAVNAELFRERPTRWERFKLGLARRLLR